MQRLSNQMRVMEAGNHFKNGASPKSRMSSGNIMHRIFLFFIVFCVGVVSALAQDIIMLRNGNEIQALVQEIGIDDVKYKKWDNQTGPNYTLKKSEIFMIKYANGDKDLITENSLPATAPDNTKPSTESQAELLYVTKSVVSGIKIKNSSGVTLAGNEITNMLATVPEALRTYGVGVNLKGGGTGFNIAGTVLICVGLVSYFRNNNIEPWGWYIPL